MAERRDASTTPWRMSRGKIAALVLLALVILLPAAFGFLTKLFKFFQTLQSDQEGGFTILPILTYLAVAAGFVCLLVWAVFQGMFRDIERPKYTMLDTERKLDEAERNPPRRLSDA